ncbi:hypothetical protein TRFO_17237 [Tritrichomonas foetus]|uniref:TFIIF beta subunit N-terminal domain-containing protein n=1 Tax=Tritrichomonas foetus TaxID=1144522 RepID=A0A1J4KTG0_9EUKA|nr:hypothetical protein TRFO_17237 [Tritrichomonas foetus]|eukprot:OHT12781.1 hypothetical protein TRFO_17237 [Tritrichomonas foetus]
MHSESAVKKEDPDSAKSHPQYALLDISKRNELVWFSKIPAYFAKDWKEIKNPTQIGEITVTPQPNGHPKLTVHFNESSVKSFPHDMLPKEFVIDVDDRIEPNRYIFTHGKDTGIVRLIGRVNVECQFKGDPIKQSLIRTYIEKKNKKKSEKLAPGDDLPVIEAANNYAGLSLRSEKKQVKDKRIKKSKQAIKSEILQLFKENPDQKLKDMALRIDQDQKYVREVLATVGEYDQTTSTWHLRKDLA